MKLFQRGKTWHVTHWTGTEQIRMSTGCTDRAEAERKALTLLLPVITQTDDEIRVATAAAICDRLALKRKLRVAEQIRLADCWNKYPHSSPRKQLKSSTIAGARIAWDNFVVFCHDRGITTIEAVTPEIAREFLIPACCDGGWSVILFCSSVNRNYGINFYRDYIKGQWPIRQEQEYGKISIWAQARQLPWFSSALNVI